jgi:hypothetical protein
VLAASIIIVFISLIRRAVGGMAASTINLLKEKAIQQIRTLV